MGIASCSAVKTRSAARRRNTHNTSPQRSQACWKNTHKRRHMHAIDSPLSTLPSWTPLCLCGKLHLHKRLMSAPSASPPPSPFPPHHWKTKKTKTIVLLSNDLGDFSKLVCGGGYEVAAEVPSSALKPAAAGSIWCLAFVYVNVEQQYDLVA